jgi:hypothetical protein
MPRIEDFPPRTPDDRKGGAGEKWSASLTPNDGGAPMAQLVTLDEHLKKRKPNGRRRSGGDEGPRHGPTREQLVAAMNEKYCWLDDEKAIFDLQYFVTRKREQVIIDMALLSAVEFLNGREKTVSAPFGVDDIEGPTCLFRA